MTGTEVAAVLLKTWAVDAVADVSAYTVGYACDELGMPAGVTFLASLANGCTVSVKAGRYVFTDSSGKIVKELDADGMQTLLKELDVDLDDMTWGGKYKGGSGTFKYKEVKTLTAEETNQWFIDNVKPDYKPPYKPGTVVKEIELTENTTFVRVYDDTPDGSGMYGSWIMKAEDIEGLTPLEIQNKFALPNTPKYVCDVKLEVGTHIRVGEVNPLDGWGSGDGTQYDLIGQRIGNFINERLLEGN